MSEVKRSPWDKELEERLVRYCAIATPSSTVDPGVPSSECQWELLKLLQQELEAMGAQKIELNAQGFLMASVPSNLPSPSPVFALLAHVDTTTQFNALDVKPLVHHNFNGNPIHLPEDPKQNIDPKEFPYLATKIGHDIVTASGNSLLGADDKAGVAIIMATARHLLSHPEIPHGEVRLCFTPDEEIGRGAKHLPIDTLGASAAYTLDGAEVGTLCYETFSADKAIIEIDGVSIHPGSAKDKLVNALHVAAAIIQTLPQSTRTPETTEKRQGFIHLVKVEGTAAHVHMHFIIRDFELAGLAEHWDVISKVCAAVGAAEPRAKIDLQFTQQYRNMRYWLEKDMRPVDLAAQAYRRAGLEPVFEVLRGGTDGSQLTERGLPTPNLFTGMQNFHGPQEWVSVQDMGEAVGVCLELAKLWGEQPPA